MFFWDMYHGNTMLFIIEVLYMSLEYHKDVTKSYTRRIVMVLVDSAIVLMFSKILKKIQ